MCLCCLDCIRLVTLCTNLEAVCEGDLVNHSCGGDTKMALLNDGVDSKLQMLKT